MAHVQYIKDLYENKDLSLREISRQTGHSFKTIQKYAYKEDWGKEDEQNFKRTKYKVLGDFIPQIDEWLTEDMKAPRKQRHTIVRIFNRLKDEHGFTGSYSCVRRYVNAKKKQMNQEKTGYLPLAQPKGHAQVDFGAFKYFDKKGDEQTGYALAISFPYSNKGFVQAFPSQNKECLLTGMQRIFEYIGGVPSNIKFDNMSTAVAKINKGSERILTDEFYRFTLHYRINAQFCNPASGNEKGNVENKVGYSRRNALVPMPTIETFEEFNKKLFTWCEDDAQRLHYKQKVTIQSLWEEEKNELLNLPKYEFPIFRYEAVAANKYGFVTIETNRYGLSPTLAGETVYAKITFDTVEFFFENQKVGAYGRSYEQNKEFCDWTQYVPTLLKKPNAVEHTRFFKKMPEQWQALLKDNSGAERKNALKLLDEIIKSGDVDLCEEAVSMAKENGRFDAESVRQCYYMISKREYYPKPLDVASSIPDLPKPTSLSAYDRLTGGAYE